MQPVLPTLTDEAIETVLKESLPMLHYPHEDVLHTEAARLHRAHETERAATLGNAYHGKLDIYFKTADGATKRVQTTVWAADDEYLTLKAGLSIPLRAVTRLDFY
jgi:hypothetical protein